jgi:hypothetical protein
MLQDHDHPVRYRNIWLRELRERAAPTEKDLARPRVISLPTEVLDRYVGEYEVSPTRASSKATFAREGNQLTVSFSFRPQRLVIEPISETEFDMPFTDGRFTFRKDDRGRVTGVLFRVGDSQREMKKVAP